jgi:hypothetical protein
MALPTPGSAIAFRKTLLPVMLQSSGGSVKGAKAPFAFNKTEKNPTFRSWIFIGQAVKKTFLTACGAAHPGQRHSFSKTMLPVMLQSSGGSVKGAKSPLRLQ